MCRQLQVLIGTERSDHFQTEARHCRAGSAILQLSLEVRWHSIAASFPVTDLGDGLMQASPERPGQDLFERQAGELLQAADETADFIRAEIDQRSGSGGPFLPLAVTAAALSVTRIAARKASASMASVMCRYQPCRERIS